MAAVANPQLVTISVNDVEIQVPKGEMIVESVKRLGIDIPIFCYHPRLDPVGMCRMCLIDVGTKMPDGTVRKMPKPQTACTLPASEGLVISTDTPQIHADRKGVLEFLLINHPLDCPVCDRGGECPLQNNTLFYGPSTSRFIEMKRHAPKAFPLSKYVTLDLERCIQCGRCVRFTEEISGDAQLAFRFRGAAMQPSTFQMTDFDSKFSGNVIEICPVGALTSSKYRFRARPWDLQTRGGICTNCAGGCNVFVDYRQNQVARINGRTNEFVNEEWTCDRGKFGHYVYNTTPRPNAPRIRQGNALVETDWNTVNQAILGAFRDGGSGVAAIGGARNSNEDLFLLRKLFAQFGSANIDYRFERYLDDAEAPIAKTPIAEIERAPQILLFGTSLADEVATMFLRVRKAWLRRGAKVVVAHSRATDADTFAEAVLRYRPGTERLLAEGLQRAARGEGVDLEDLATATGIGPDALRQAAAILGPGTVIITTTTLNQTADGGAIRTALSDLASSLDGTFNQYATATNAQGAALLGLGGEQNTTAILRGCVNGDIQALWIVGVDTFAAYPDANLVREALESVPFLVVQDWQESEAMHYASVVLPMTSPLESEATFTNVERRVQYQPAILPVQGHARPAWRVYADLCQRISPGRPYFNIEEIDADIRREYPVFAVANDAEIREFGALIPA